ncbi:MAG: hypothetical protein ACFFA6_17120 [Promethearchaeota archaeon]
MHDIDKVMQRTRRYWYEDGLAEIAAGCLFVLIGLLFFFVESVVPPGPPRAIASAIGLPALIVGASWVAGRVVKVIKARFTYLRTGYIAYHRRPEGHRRWITVGIGAAMITLVVLLIATAPISLAWIPMLDGLIISAFLLYLGHTLGLVRFYILAFLSILLGAMASLGGLGDTLGSAVYFGGMGVALIASGGLSLWAYLRQTQPPVGE